MRGQRDVRVSISAIALAGTMVAGANAQQVSVNGIARLPPTLAAPRAANARVAAQIAGSLLAAGIVGFASWAVVDNPEGSDRRVKGDAGYTPNANTAYGVGSFVGSVIAAYWIGRGDGSRASWAATALGAGLATIPLALGRHEPYLPIIGLVMGAPAQAIGATLGYQLTRASAEAPARAACTTTDAEGNGRDERGGLRRSRRQEEQELFATRSHHYSRSTRARLASSE